MKKTTVYSFIWYKNWFLYKYLPSFHYVLYYRLYHSCNWFVNKFVIALLILTILPLNEPLIPKVPFESIVCDNFYFRGWYYLVAADRLTGWTEQQRIKLDTNESSSKELCKACVVYLLLLFFQLKYHQMVFQSFQQKLPRIF